jgi:hypothetical protein
MEADHFNYYENVLCYFQLLVKYWGSTNISGQAYISQNRPSWQVKI